MFKGILQNLSKKAVIAQKGYKKVYEEDLATNILAALGGKENIRNLDACFTRLRISVNDLEKVDKDRIMSLGAQGILKIGNNIQAVFGSSSQELKEQIECINLKNKGYKVEKTKKQTKEINDEFLFVSPLSGKLLPLEDVPDEVFSKKMMGDGFAIQPVNGEVVSPVNGKIETFFPTKHAIGIVANNGLKILIHFGIDTVNLKGEGLEALVKQGDTVKIGQPILRVNLNKVKAEVPSVITPIIFTNLSKGTIVSFKLGLDVKAGQGQIININPDYS